MFLAAEEYDQNKTFVLLCSPMPKMWEQSNRQVRKAATQSGGCGIYAARVLKTWRTYPIRPLRANKELLLRGVRTRMGTYRAFLFHYKRKNGRRNRGKGYKVSIHGIQ